MSHVLDPRAPRPARRNSPGAGRGANVVSLDAWRKARASRANHAGTRGRYVGARTEAPGALRPDRLGRALAWCAYMTATGVNPFDPKGLHGRA